jgi:hypothetical protein
MYMMMDQPSAMASTQILYDVGSGPYRRPPGSNQLQTSSADLSEEILLLIRDLVRKRRRTRNVMGKRRSS